MARAGAKFRSRKIDPRRALPVYFASHLKEIADVSSAGRALAEVSTGVEKDEEKEHHLQAAISSYTAAYVSDSAVSSSTQVAIPTDAATSSLSSSSTDCGPPKPATTNAATSSLIYIPTPSAHQAVSPEAYGLLHPTNYVRPSSNIRFSAVVEDCIGCPYNADDHDESFLASHEAPAGLSRDSFEFLMHALESLVGERSITASWLPNAHNLGHSRNPVDLFPSLDDARSSLFRNQFILPPLLVGPSPLTSLDLFPGDLGGTLPPNLEPFFESVYKWWFNRRVARGYRPIAPTLGYEDAMAPVATSTAAPSVAGSSFATPSMRSSISLVSLPPPLRTQPPPQQSPQPPHETTSSVNTPCARFLLRFPSAALGTPPSVLLQNQPKITATISTPVVPAQSAVTGNASVVSTGTKTPTAKIAKAILAPAASRLENDPYVCFRRRDIRMIRKTRRTDIQAADLLRRFRLEMETIRSLAALVYRREALRMEALISETKVFDCRVKLHGLRNGRRPAASSDGDHLTPEHQLFYQDCMPLYTAVPSLAPDLTQASGIPGTLPAAAASISLLSRAAGSATSMAQSNTRVSNSLISPCLRKSIAETSSIARDRSLDALSPAGHPRNLQGRGGSTLKRATVSNINLITTVPGVSVARHFSPPGHINLHGETLPLVTESIPPEKRIQAEEIPSLGEISNKQAEEFVSQRLAAYQDYEDLTLAQLPQLLTPQSSPQHNMNTPSTLELGFQSPVITGYSSSSSLSSSPSSSSKLPICLQPRFARCRRHPPFTASR